MKRTFFYSLLLSIHLLLSSCGTTEQPTRSRIPPTSNSRPEYISDQKLESEIEQLNRRLEDDPNNSDLLLRLGALYVELKKNDEAVQTLERLKTLNYKKEPKVYASLAELYDSQENYTEALKNYEIFKNLLPEESPLQAKVDEKIAGLEYIITTLDNPFDLEIKRLSSDINTDDSEYLSQFTIDESRLVFTRRYNGQEDLFIATKQEDASYEVLPIEAVNTPFNEGAHTISADGSLLIFTHCNEKFGFGGCDLYQSKRLPNGDWSSPSNMGERINTRHWESQPSLSADGQTLYFASNNPNGKGGSDIWVTTRRSDGLWAIPKNLGSQVNTPSREESPFIHQDGQTLYFRSKGHRGLGDFDIFRVQKENGKWGEVLNLGSPINSSGNEGALVVSLDGTRGFYATDTYKGEKLNHLDIVQFELPLAFRPVPMTYFKGRITGKDSNLPLDAQIKIETENGKSKTYNTDYNGEFLIAIPVGQPNYIHVISEGYVFYSDHITYDEVRYGVDPHYLEIALEVPELSAAEDKTEPIILKNIFFETGSAQLKASSEIEIQVLYQMLVNFPNIKIQIIGHTDDVGNDADNLLLSQRRAEAVRQALIDRGIDSERMAGIGKGKNEPIDTNATEAGRANNRRTEFIIIK